MTRSSFSQPVARRTRRSIARAPVAYRPQFERLENRTVPSTVTNLADSGPGSLRDAIINTSAGGTVDFQAGLTGTILLSSGELAIGNDLTIAGPGAGVLTVSGNQAYRVFDVTGPFNVVVSGLRIANGMSSGGGGILNVGTLRVAGRVLSGNSLGGGIFNTGTLTVTNTVVTGNSTGTGASFTFSYGGGIFNYGTAIVTDSVVSSNQINGFGNGGGVENIGMLTIIDSTISANSARGGSGFGGGIWSDGSLTVIHSTVSGNSSTLSGGGIYRQGGSLTVIHSTLSGNDAGMGISAGGGIYFAADTAYPGSPGSGVYFDTGMLDVTNRPAPGQRRPDPDDGPAAGQSGDQRGR